MTEVRRSRDLICATQTAGVRRRAVTSRLRHDGEIAITVADNGVGLQSVTQRKHPFEGGGFGLWSIEHRLGELGGTLEMANDSGLRATVVVPRRFLLRG